MIPGELLWHGSIALALFIILNLFDNYNETTIPDCPLYCSVEHTHKGIDGPENTIPDSSEPPARDSN